MIIDVQCDDDTIQIARIVEEREDSYIIQFLEKNTHHVYDFADEEVTISKDSVSGFYDTDDLGATDLYMKVQHGYELLDDSEDEDYQEESESESEGNISLVDEDEEEA